MSAARILVVDDNLTNLKLVVDVLECEGHEIFKAVNATEAEEIIRRERPSLVLMDIALPGMDGLTLTRKLRADATTKDLVIIALTAFAMKGDEQKAIEAGCNGYITKPIETRSLPGVVARFLPPPPAPVPALPLNILVIEDAVSELKLAQQVLTVAGHRVRGSEAAEEALAAIRQNPPQIILLDMLLPGVDGLALARRLKAEPDTSRIPIVAITSFPERFSRDEALAAGCEAYLVKPMDTRRLPQQLQDVMNATRSTQEGQVE
jgi:two-component system cell cycle response regulator